MNSEKTITKIVRINRKSVLIKFEDGTYLTDSIKSLTKYYLDIPIKHVNEKAIITFFENKEENKISNTLYRLYNRYFAIKLALSQQ